MKRANVSLPFFIFMELGGYIAKLFYGYIVFFKRFSLKG